MMFSSIPPIFVMLDFSPCPQWPPKKQRACIMGSFLPAGLASEDLRDVCATLEFDCVSAGQFEVGTSRKQKSVDHRRCLDS